MSVTFLARTNDPADGKFAELIEGPNFANGNAAMILRSLDLEPDEYLVGNLDLDDFEGRVLLALAVSGSIEDDGQPDIESGGPGTGRARMIDCGIRPGYFADAYQALAEFCTECRAENAKAVYYA